MIRFTNPLIFMAASAQPSDIAREVLRLFASRRLPPTPDNFRDLYHEVAGTTDDNTAAHEKLLRALAARLPADTAERLRLVKQLQRAVAEKKLEEANHALFAYIETVSSEAPPSWNVLIRNLLRQWELRQLGWTPARKRESLERVLAANDPDTLFIRLQGLVRAWTQAPSNPETATSLTPVLIDSEAETEPEAAAPPEVKLLAQGEASEMIQALRETLVTALDNLVPACLDEHPELTREAQNFSIAVRAAHQPSQLKTLGSQLRKFAYKLELVTTDSLEIRSGLVNLLRLLLENIEEIVLDDRWLQGQVESVRDVVNQPVTLRQIDEAERRLKEVIFKQSQLKHNLKEAQASLRHMLAGFMDQLATLSTSTGKYHDNLARSAQRISQANDIAEISVVLDEVMRDTQSIQAETLRTRAELEEARERASQAETRMQELQLQLEEASRLMRHDQLTGALNRRGLEEIFEKESSRALRRNAPICVALLDIDNFKRLNDTYGHSTGDEALIHLTQVIRANLRPNDTAARLGGEEFVILYPETDLEEAQLALIRLQRALTKAYFLANEQRLLITFSAGVTLWQPGEALNAALNRADEAMYEAKQTGKNKVVAH